MYKEIFCHKIALWGGGDGGGGPDTCCADIPPANNVKEQSHGNNYIFKIDYKLNS